MTLCAAADDDDDAIVASHKRRYVNITGFPFPLTPLLSRKTMCAEVVSGQVWTLEQEQGIGLGLGVSTNVRMTVVKMSDGRLWIHDPIAPTEECIDMVRPRRKTEPRGYASFLSFVSSESESLRFFII